MTRVDFENYPVCGTPVSGFCVLDDCGHVVQLALKIHSAIQELNAPFGAWQWAYLGNGTPYEPLLLMVRFEIEARGTTSNDDIR